MIPRKGRFGYSDGESSPHEPSKDDWFDPSCFMVQAESILEDTETEKVRFTWGKIIVAIGFVIMLVRVTTLQIVEGAEHRFLAEGNRVRQQITLPPRGLIVDQRGESLVKNEPGYSVDIIPSELPRKKEARDDVIKKIATLRNIDPKVIEKVIGKEGLVSSEPVVIDDTITREDAIIAKVKLATTPGVRISFSPKRVYDTTPGLAHLLGYTARMNEQDVTNHPEYPRSSIIGRSGLESSYDNLLRGEVGTNEVEVNANGQFQRVLYTRPPQVGQTLRLTLDKGLQQEMAASLQDAMSKNGAKQAVGVAMDAKTGGILASVSVPTYDNNLFAQGISSEEFKKLQDNPDTPLLNRAIHGLYPAGSTIKPFIAAAALEEGTITNKTTLDTSIGVIKIGQWEFPDWKVHGTTDVGKAIAESNDIFFYALGGGWDKIPGLGVERIKKYLRIFGFGESSEIDFANDATGLIPDPDWKKRVKKESWYIGDTYHIAIGQGDLLVTPIQLARALSSIANGGTLVRPHLVNSSESAGGIPSPDLIFETSKLPLSADTLRTVQEGMRRTVDSSSGSARTLAALPFTSAGKTGTAQFGSEEKTHAWYIGYAPYENPEIVVVVLVEGGGEGNAISVPVAGRVFSYYMSHK